MNTLRWLGGRGYLQQMRTWVTAAVPNSQAHPMLNHTFHLKIIPTIKHFVQNFNMAWTLLQYLTNITILILKCHWFFSLIKHIRGHSYYTALSNMQVGIPSGGPRLIFGVPVWLIGWWSSERCLSHERFCNWWIMFFSPSLASKKYCSYT